MFGKKEIKAKPLGNYQPVEAMEIVHLSRPFSDLDDDIEWEVFESAYETDGNLVRETEAEKESIVNFSFNQDCFYQKAYGFHNNPSVLKKKKLSFENHSYVVMFTYHVDRIPNTYWLKKPVHVTIYLKDIHDEKAYKAARKVAKKYIHFPEENPSWDDICFPRASDIKEKRQEEPNLTKEMQRLEGLLLKLRSLNKEEYKRLNAKYQEMLISEEKLLVLTPLTLASITSLANQVEMAIALNGSIKEYFNQKIKEEIKRIKNHEEGAVSIQQLDEMTEYFLKKQVSPQLQNDVLKKMSILYFLSIYQKKDSITSKELLDSYANDNITRMVIGIDTLKEEGILENVPNSIYDVKTMEDFIKAIQTIDFVIKKEEPKEYKKATN